MDASSRDASSSPDAATPDADASTPDPDGGATDASVARDGGADAARPLGMCTLERTIELASPRGTPSIVSDGAHTFALWAEIGDGVRGLDIDGTTPWPTDLPDGPLYAPVPFARWRDGIRVAAFSENVHIGRFGGDGTALETSTVVALPAGPAAGSACDGPVVLAGDTEDLVVWAQRTSSGACTDLHYALADASGVRVSETSFPLAAIRTPGVWDGTSWVFARNMAFSDAVELVRVGADGAAITSTVTTRPRSGVNVDEVAIARGSGGLVVALRYGRSIDVASVDAALAIAAPSRVADSPSDVDRIELAAGRDGLALVWTSPRALSFVALDASGLPITEPLRLSRPSLVSRVSALSSVTVPVAIVESDAGWRLAWIETRSLPALSAGIVGVLRCDAP